MKDKKIKSKKVILASDHAGFKLKEEIKKFLIKKRKKIMDLGTYSTNSVDYPDYGEKLAMALSKDADARGVAICGSGIGISIAVNRFPWARAALVNNVEA